jgi:protein-histidine N-methyltransferase
LNEIPGLTFTFADYNEEVLRLVTLPNVLLTWAASTENSGFPPADSDDSDNQDLEITPDLIERFAADLKTKDITLNFVSGPWSSSLANLIPESAPDRGLLILAAETIYSPASTIPFVELLDILLRRVKMAKAMIGAKRMYFGVGGSVDGLKEACREKGAVAYEIENHGVPGMDGGVGRALIEVQMF